MAVKMVKVLVSLTAPMKAQLDTLKQEGYSASGYLRTLLRRDLDARKETGWVPGKGWPEDDTTDLQARRRVPHRPRARRTPAGQKKGG